MKKLLFSAVSFALMGSSSVFGQTTNTPIKTAADSVSYAYGAALTESLPMYLQQMGILADTTSIRMDYNNRIEDESDKVKKAQLKSALKMGVDSADAANKVAMQQFQEGFAQTMLNNKNSEAYNSGVAIASQISGMLNGFSAQLLTKGETLNKDLFVTAFMRALNNEEFLLGGEPQELIENRMKVIENRKAEELKAESAAYIAEGDKFMAKNKKKKGVKTLPSGLQYKVVTKGKGAMPAAYDKVTVHYKGTLLDGTPFDSSYDRGEPATFGVSQVIKGWTEALQLMPVGSKWTLYIPYDLAYGENGAGDNVKPYSNLIFDVELIEIVQEEYPGIDMIEDVQIEDEVEE